MSVIRRYIYREIIYSVAFVTLGFLALFFFFDFVDELRKVGRYAPGQYSIPLVTVYVLLSVPKHLYELLPITVLIGVIFVMARLAQTSEYTILRTSGLDPFMALRMLALLGVLFSVLTFFIGDYVAPRSETMAEQLKLGLDERQLTIGQTGAWLRERDASGNSLVNAGSLSRDATVQSLRIFSWDSEGRAVAITRAEKAHATAGRGWQLEQVRRTLISYPEGENAPPVLEHQSLEQWQWVTTISADMIAAALVRPDDMSTLGLFQYIRHLNANNQAAQRYEIEFWRKVFYPMSCLVMVVLALPFAYLHLRSSGIAGYIFGGVMTGIVFFVLNNIFGTIGDLQNWAPWLAAATPGMIFSLLSLAAFGWLVLRH